LAFAFHACVKETSYESGKGLGGVVTGTLKDSLGNCQNIIIKGNYAVDSVLNDSNYIVVQLNVTSVGTYKITTDTINGYWFSDSSYLLFSGIQSIKLKGHGKPILPLSSTFTVTYASSQCQFTISVTGASTADYFPISGNSFWKYNYSWGDTLRVTSLGVNYVLNSTVYSIFQNSYAVGNDSVIYRKDGVGNYYTYSYLDDSAVAPVEYIFLKDNVTNNTAWDSPEATTTYLGKSSKVKYTYTMLNNNTSFIVNGVTFNNVIRLKEETKYLVNGTYTSTYFDYAYYAKGVGLIYIEAPANGSSAAVTQSLVKYKVY
jgi:hypothetical protein